MDYPIYKNPHFMDAGGSQIHMTVEFEPDPETGARNIGPIVTEKGEALFKQATSKEAPFGAIADYVAPVSTVVPVSAPRWKVLIVLNDRGLYDVINNELKKDLENKLEGSFANWQAWNNADRIASDSAIVAGLLSRFPLTNDDVYDIIQKANKISG